MIKIKKPLAFVILLLLLLSFSACGLIKEMGEIKEGIDRDNDDLTSPVTVNYKQDSFVNGGQFSAVYGERIYFLSQEKGEGIHSMNLNGTDIRFEFEVPKIAELIINENTLYYLGVSEIQQNSNRTYDLFSRNRQTGETKKIVYKDNMEDNRTVSRAYVTESGTVFICENTSIYSSVEDPNGLYIYNDSDTLQKNETQLEDRMLIEAEDYMLVYPSEKTGKYDNPRYFSEEWSVVDKRTSGLCLSENMFSDRYFRVVFFDESYYYAAYYNELHIIDRATNETEEKITFSILDTENNWINNAIVRTVLDRGEYLAVLMGTRFETSYVYYVDKNSFSFGEMPIIEDGWILIDTDSEGYLYFDGKTLIKQQVYTYGFSDIIFEIKLRGIKEAEGLFEIAGDWLFIYEKSNSEEPNKLLYRINIETQEVVDLR